MREKYDLAVFCGRFQPFHKGHREALDHAYEVAEKVLILIGSSKAASNTKNPFSFEERRAMIGEALTRDEQFKTEFAALRDYFYSENDDLWIAEVQEVVSRFTTPNSTVVLVGRYKDETGYWLNAFPQWDRSQPPGRGDISATQVRDLLFSRTDSTPDWPFNPYQPESFMKAIEHPEWRTLIPDGVARWLEDNYLKKAKYAYNVIEYNQLRSYKNSWKDAPFPPTFVTVDTVVLCAGHILLVKRKFNPGKGQMALPGGFVKQEERLIDAALRELKEETGIIVGRSILKEHLDGNRVFDYPERSLRGRTITHAFCIRLPYKELPTIRSGSDADQVRWVPVADAMRIEDQYFEDHYSIIMNFLVR